MEKYKVCPSCHTKNEPTLFECIHCEADLTSVKITDAETESMSDASGALAAAALVRICECGNVNPSNARKCSACGEDISDISPVEEPAAAEEQTISFLLSSLDGQYAYKISADETTIGREKAMREYLALKGYVSREHAKLFVEEGMLYVENLSRTNYSYVNNVKIEGRTRLEDGDELGLGGIERNGQRQSEAAYFLVRIGTCM